MRTVQLKFVKDDSGRTVIDTSQLRRECLKLNRELTRVERQYLSGTKNGSQQTKNKFCKLKDQYRRAKLALEIFDKLSTSWQDKTADHLYTFLDHLDRPALPKELVNGSFRLRRPKRFTVVPLGQLKRGVCPTCGLKQPIILSLNKNGHKALLLCCGQAHSA